MSAKPRPRHADEVLIERIEILLAQAEHQDNPLREALAQLFAHSEGQRHRLERLVRISDGYQTVARSNSLSLAEQYDRQLRRLEKLARISDQLHQLRLTGMAKALASQAQQADRIEPTRLVYRE